MISRVIWLFFSALFGFMTVVLGVEVWHACTSKSWPVTHGVVVAFYATPEYKYSVGGQNYSSSYASCNDLFDYGLVMRNSEKYASEYPLRAKVTVHYCPQKPALAVLETRFDSSAWISVGVLFLMTSLCVAGFVFGWRFRFAWKRSAIFDIPDIPG